MPPPEPTDPLRAELIAAGLLRAAAADYEPPLRAYVGRAMDDWTDVEPERAPAATR